MKKSGVKSGVISSELPASLANNRQTRESSVRVMAARLGMSIPDLSTLSMARLNTLRKTVARAYEKKAREQFDKQ